MLLQRLLHRRQQDTPRFMAKSRYCRVQFRTSLLFALARSPDTAATPWTGPFSGPLPLDGSLNPPSMGPSGGEGALRADLGLFALVRRYATLESVWLIQSPSMASFVGPRRAELWKTDD